MSAKDKVTIDSYAKEIKDRGLSVPAIFFLEMFKYLSFIFSQSMIVFGPLATIFINQKKYYQFSDIISKRSNVELLICEIENKSK
tara:strand:+ start:137 stop:391 length:255 start_codon:yes stop_codon:yes gene_type:complete